MALKNHEELALYAILIVFFVCQALVILYNNNILWDESVYIGMGKYIFSGGSSGLWEPIRPVFLPLLAGALWKLKLDPLLYGRLLVSILSVGSIIITYHIAKRIFQKNTAIISALLLMAAPVFFGYSSFLLTDIPSTFFALSSIYLFISNPQSSRNLFFSGLLSGIAFITRFPQIIILASLLLSLILENRGHYKENIKPTLKKTIILLAGFAIAATPYFAFNYESYGTAFRPLIDAQITVSAITGANGPQYAYYFKYLIEQNFLPLLWMAGIVLILVKKRIDKTAYPVLLASIFFIIYLTSLPHKELRYILIALPLMSIIGSYPLAIILEKSRIGFKWLSLILAAYLIAVAYPYSGLITGFFEERNNIQIEKEIADKIQSFKNNEPVYTSIPIIAAYIDNPLIASYHTPKYFTELSLASNKSAYIALAGCSFLCNEGDYGCEKRKRDMISEIASKSALLWNKNTTKCEYYLFGFSGKND